MPRPDRESRPGMGNAAMRWFGDTFVQLHPLLQALHRHGGCLRGEVRINTGEGWAGVIGRRLARRLGIPTDRPVHDFQVHISHDDESMRWERHFGNGAVLRSTFRPVGRLPDGYWLEDAGRLRFKLGVDVVDGGWHWRLRGVSLHGVALPRWLFPDIAAFKCVDDDGRYRFGVSFSLFLIGPVLGYEGRLHALPDRAPQARCDPPGLQSA